MSRRLVRSPATPKMTIVQGGAGGASAAPGMAHQGRTASFMGGSRSLRFDMAAEALAHGREELVGEARILARAEAGIERGREHGGRHGLLDGRLHGPAALSRILHMARKVREVLVGRERRGREVEEPR